jgi:hypothetical protein
VIAWWGRKRFLQRQSLEFSVKERAFQREKQR